MILAMVIFEYNQVGGWRVHSSLDLAGMTHMRPHVIHAGGLLSVCGNFRRKLRRGTWCKRPHKELAYRPSNITYAFCSGDTHPIPTEADERRFGFDSKAALRRLDDFEQAQSVYRDWSED
jgi:hypothetical protein